MLTLTLTTGPNQVADALRQGGGRGLRADPRRSVPRLPPTALLVSLPALRNVDAAVGDTYAVSCTFNVAHSKLSIYRTSQISKAVGPRTFIFIFILYGHIWPRFSSILAYG